MVANFLSLSEDLQEKNIFLDRKSSPARIQEENISLKRLASARRKHLRERVSTSEEEKRGQQFSKKDAWDASLDNYQLSLEQEDAKNPGDIGKQALPSG